MNAYICIQVGNRVAAPGMMRLHADNYQKITNDNKN